MAHRLQTISCLLMLGAATAANAVAQSSATATGGSGQPASDAANARNSKPGLRVIEAGVGDNGPLSANPRQLRVDLREAAGFDRVYQLPWQQSPGSLGRPGNYVRFDSGVAAVFPQSFYQQSGYGQVARVPAGTTFYIGKLPDSVLQSGVLIKAPPPVLRVERGLNFSAKSDRPLAPPPPQAPSTRVDLRANTDGSPRPPAPANGSLLEDPKARERWIDRLGTGGPR